MRTSSALFLLFAVAQGANAHEGVHHARARVEARLSRSPTPEQHLHAARLARRTGDFIVAFEHIGRARALAPADAGPDREEGLVHAAAGDAGPAERYLTRYLLREPADREALWARAKVRVAQGNWRAASADYQLAINRAPHPDLCLERSTLLLRHHRGRASVHTLRGCLRALGDAVVLRQALVQALAKSGQPREALLELRSLLNASPESVPWRLQRAELLTRIGRRREAKRVRRATLALADRALETRVSALRLVDRARALAALGRRRLARQAVERALGLAPRFAEARALRRELSP